MMIKIAPSILSADLARLGAEVDEIRTAGADFVHFDVMDGWFVPSISFGMPVLRSIRPLTDLFYDVHLMVQDPGRYVDDFADAGADGITVHAEACVHLDRVLDEIRARGLKTGVALNPATPLSVLDYVYDKTDMILLMTVNPGFGGQKLIPAMLDKIRQLREILNGKHLSTLIEVDGGIHEQTIQGVIDAGANVIVAGSGVFGDDIAGSWQRLTSYFPVDRKDREQR